MTIFTSRAHSLRGYTLLEILLALGIIAVLLGIAVPYFSDSLRPTPGEEASSAVEKIVLAVRGAALENGEARRLNLLKNGVEPDLDSIPKVSLPPGWKLEVRRMTESKFRAPERDETWEFNSAGICEPLTLRLSSEKELITLSFDPLTALVVNDE